jgi:hypothetical protein
MRPLATTALLLLMFFCSCEKSDTSAPEEPAIIMTGTWQLAATMPPQDTSWQYVSSRDSAFYSFDTYGHFEYASKTSRQSGTYKVLPSGAGIKLIATESDNSLSQYFQIEQVSDSTIRIDDWLKGITKASPSQLFKKIH